MPSKMVNFFPKANSGGLAPTEIVRDRQQKILKIKFRGIYVQVYVENNITNTMEQRTFGALNMGPTGNTQGTYLFMSLLT